MKFLIIDDSKAITTAISLFAEEQGHSCIISNDGKEGCDLAKKENFDLILLDIAMPGFSGYDVLNKLKDDSSFDMKKIVIISATNMDSSATEKIESYGVFKFVSKPFSLDSLKDIFSKFT